MLNIKIGKLKLKNKYFLAPMLEVNDIAFRLLCRKAGAGLVYTGMIYPLSRQKLDLKDKPALQLFSNSEKGIEEFIRKNDKKVALWDFNLGCPSKKAGKSGIGTYLTDLKKIEKILKMIRKSTKKPLTLKIRKSKNWEKILKIAEKYCDALAIHPRTKEQGYSGLPDVEFARKLRKKSRIPVIYSGDVDENNAKEFLKEFDFVMIGRKAIGNPGIFAKLAGNIESFEKPSKNFQNSLRRTLKEGENTGYSKSSIDNSGNCITFSPELSICPILKQRQKINRIVHKKRFDFFDYLKLAEKYKLPFSQIKRQAVWFLKGKSGARKLREKIMKVKNLEELKKRLH